jgi:hypothetical protein
MGSRATIAALRIGALLAACVLAAAASRGADAGAQGPWDALALKGGRVLHNARVLSDEGDSVVIRCDEGLVKVAKSSLPQAAADAYPAKPQAPAGPEMVMMPFNPDAAPTLQEPEEKPKPKPKPAANTAVAPAASPSPVFKGCTIASFSMKPFQNSLGCAEVVVQNATEARVVLLPGDIACVTAAGKRLGGRQIVMDGFPPVIKRRQVIPPLGSADFMVTFSNESLDGSSVLWAR